MSGLSTSLMGKFDFESSMSPHSSSQVCLVSFLLFLPSLTFIFVVFKMHFIYCILMSSLQGEDSAGSIDTMSLCKSELLFSPVKESAVPGTINFSVDSLDSDIMLTCQANKDNYTIAFEGSTTMGSEDSQEFHDHGKSRDCFFEMLL